MQVPGVGTSSMTSHPNAELFTSGYSTSSVARNSIVCICARLMCPSRMGTVGGRLFILDMFCTYRYHALFDSLKMRCPFLVKDTFEFTTCSELENIIFASFSPSTSMQTC